MSRDCFVSYVLMFVLSLSPLSSGALAQDAPDTAAPAAQADADAAEAKAADNPADAAKADGTDAPANTTDAAPATAQADVDAADAKAADNPADAPKADGADAPAKTTVAAPRPKPDPKRNIRFQYDGIPFNDVIKQFAQSAGKPILGEFDVEGELTFFDAEPYTLEEAKDTLNIMLATRGFMIVEDGRFIRVVALVETALLPVKILDGLDKLEEQRPSAIVTVVLPVEHIDVESTAKALVPMVTIVGKIAPLTRGKAILLTDRAGNVKRIRSLLALMDRDPDDQKKMEMKSYHIKLASADAVASVINSVVRGTSSRSSSSSSSRSSSPSSSSTIIAMADQRTNSVVVRGTADMIELADQVVQMLDDPKATGGETMKAFALKTAEADDVEDAIQVMFGGSRSSSSSSSRTSSSRRVFVYGDTSMNSVLVRANAADMVKIEELIQKLDGAVTNFNNVQAFTLKHVTAEAIGTVLQGVLSPRAASSRGTPAKLVAVTVDKNTNTIYVSGPPHMLEKAAQIIKEIDQDKITANREIHIVALEDADAPTLANSLTQMYKQQLGESPTPGAMPVIQGIASSNSLLISSSAEQWVALQKLIDQVKEATVPTDVPITRIIPLKHARATELAVTLRTVYEAKGETKAKVVTPSQQQSSSSSRKVPQAQPIADRGKPSITIAAAEHNNSLVIVAIEKDQKTIADAVATLDVPADAAIDPIQLVELKSANAESLAKTLMSMVPKPERGQSQEVFIEADPSTNAVLIRAPESQRKMIEEMIAKLDKKTQGAARELRMIEVKHVSATGLVPMLQQLFGNQTQGRPNLTGDDARYYWYYMARYRAEAGIQEDEQQAIDPTAKVVIAAAPGDRMIVVDAPRPIVEQIERMIKTLDREDGPAQQQVRTYTLTRSNAAELAQSLARLFSKDTRGQPQTPGAEAPARFEADTTANQLLVSATPAQYEAIEKVIEEVEKSTVQAMQTKTFPLRFANAVDVVPVLETMLVSEFGQRTPSMRSFGSYSVYAPQSAKKTDVRVAAMPATNHIVVQGPPDKLVLAEELIKTFDTKEAIAGTVVQVVFLKNAQAPSLASAVQAVLAAKAQRLSVSPNSRASTQPTDEVVVTPEPNSNSVLVRGSAAQVEAAVKMIERLDQQSDSGTTQMRIFKLKEGDAAALATNLDKLFADIIKQQGSRADGLTPPPFSVGADDRTNSLVVSTTPAYFLLVEQLLEQLDKAPQRADRNVQYFVLKNADAWDMADQIEAMYEDREGDEKPVVQADLFSNALTVVAKDADLKTIEEIVSKVDAAAEDNSIQVRVFPARSMKAAKLAQALKNLYEQTADTDVIVTDRIPRPGDVVIPLDQKKQGGTDKPGVQPVKDGANDKVPGERAQVGEEGKAGPAAQANAQAAPKKKPQVIIAVDEATNSLIISGTGDQLDEIDMLMFNLSGTSTTPEYDVRVFPVRHTDPAVIVRVINSLFNPNAARQQQQQNNNQAQLMQQQMLNLQQQMLNQQGRGERPGGDDSAGQGRGQRNQRNQGNQGNQRGQRNNNQPAGPTVSAVADTRSNKVIVRGKLADLDLIGELIQQLDTSTLIASEVRVFTLQHTDATQVATNLRELVTGQIGGGRASSVNSQRAVLIKQQLAQQVENAVDMATVVSIAANAQTNSVIVAAPGEAMGVIAHIVEEIDQSAALAATPSVRLYPVKHADMATMVANLNSIFQPMISGAGQRSGQGRVVITGDASSGAIIVSAFPDQHEMIDQVIKEIDKAQPGEALVIKVYPIENADAASVAQTLSQTLIPGGQPTRVNQSTLRFLRQPGGRGGNIPVAPGTSANSATQGYAPLRITADQSSNTLVVRATEEEHARIAELLQQIDIAPASTQPVQLIALQHADPVNVAQVLNRIYVDQDQSQQGRFLRNLRRGGGNSIVIEGDPDSRMLMVRADEKTFAKIKELATQLDVASPAGQLARKLIKLKHAQASSVAQALTQAFAPSTTGRTATAIQAIGRPNGAGRTARAEDENDLVTVVAEPVSNSIIVTASEANHIKVAALIDQIDTQEQSGVVTQFLVLKNASAPELSVALSRVAGNLSASPAQFVRGQRAGNTGVSATQTVVSADSASNALIFSGPSTDVERLKTMASQLDVTAADVETGAYIIPIKNGDATQMAQIVRDLYLQTMLGGKSLGNSTLAVSAEPISNSLVVVCDQKMLMQLKFLTAQLDFIAPKRGEVRVVTLKHADPVELQKAIQEIYGGDAVIAQPNQVQGQGTAPANNAGQPRTAPAGNRQGAQPRRGGQRGSIGTPGTLGSAAAAAGVLPAQVAPGTGNPQGRVSTTVLPQQRSILITANDDDFAAIKKLAEAMDAAAAGSARKTKVVVLKNTSNTRIATALNQMYAAAARSNVDDDKVSVTALQGTDAIVIAAVQSKLPEVEELVKQLDAKEVAPQLEFRIYTLQHVTPSKVVPMVKQMLDRAQQATGGDAIDIQADDRTKSIIVSAKGNVFDQVGKVIEVLDREPVHAATEVTIVQLQRADATRLAAVLNETLKPAADGQVTAEARALQEQVKKLSIKDELGRLVTLDLTKPIRIIADPINNDDQGANALVVASTKENISALKALVALMDRVPLAEELRVRIVKLDNADATSVAQMLTQLFAEGQKLLAGRVGSSTEGKAEPQDATGKGLVNPLNVSVDVRTNTLVMSGRNETLLLAQQVVEQVDQETPVELREITLVQLKNAEATSLAPTLQTMLDARVTRQASLGIQDAERFRVIVAADARSNSLLVGGSRDGIKLVEDLAKKMDDQGPALAGQIQLFALKHANSGTMSITLQALFDQRYAAATTPDVQRQKPIILPDLRSNALLVAANADDTNVLKGLLEKMDKELTDPAVSIEVVSLKHNDAGIVGPSVQRLFQARLTANTVPGTTPAPQDQVNIEYDALSNAIIISASKENHTLIKQLLTKVDIEPPIETSVVRMYPLQIADAQRVGTVLQSLLEQGLYKPGSVVAQDNAVVQAREKIAVEVDTRTNVLIVSASKENFNVIEQIIKQLDSSEDYGALADVRLYVLKFADATRLAPTLQQFFDAKRAAEQQTGGGAGERSLAVSVIPDARTNTLLVAGSREHFSKVEAMVRGLDQQQIKPASEFRIFVLKQATAAAIQPTIQQLFAQRVARGDTTDPVTVVADARANALVVGASYQDMQMVEGLVRQLDIEPKREGSMMHVFPLRKADANQVATTLRNLYASQGGARTVAAGTGNAGGDAGGVTISVDERVNALVVSAGKADLLRIGELIKQLDTDTVTHVTEVRVFTLEFADATAMSELLNQTLTAPMATPNPNESPSRQTLLQVVSIDKQSGEQIVSRALKEGVLITPDVRTNSVVVSAPLDYMPLLERLIRELDLTSPREAQIRVFTLKNADAQQMADVLTSLFRMEAAANAGEERAIKYTLRLPDGSTSAATATIGTDQKYALTVTVDPRTNSLLVGGTQHYVGLCSEMIETLDASPAQERVTRVYRLRHGQAVDIEASLGSFLDQERQRLQAALGNDRLGAAQRLLEREVSIVAEPTSNTLLVSASPRYFPQIEQMVIELDAPKPQVLIQAVLAEVTLDDGLDLGVEWQVNKEVGSTNVGVGTDFGIEDAFNAFGGMGVGIAGSDFSIFMRALQTQGKLELISRPQILASDNQPASINIGQRVPFVTNSRITEDGSTVNTVQYENVGIILDVTARLTDDGFVTMDIHPEVSSISDTSVQISEAVNAVVIDTRSADTRVTVQDGQTVVIGGLITASDSFRVAKVPLLGDIPILGEAFKSTSRDRQRRELLIILTPKVIRTVEQADAISRRQRERLESMKQSGENMRDKGLDDKSFTLPLKDVYPAHSVPNGHAKPEDGDDKPATSKNGKPRQGPTVIEIDVGKAPKSSKPPPDKPTVEVEQ